MPTGSHVKSKYVVRKGTSWSLAAPIHALLTQPSGWIHRLAILYIIYVMYGPHTMYTLQEEQQR